MPRLKNNNKGNLVLENNTNNNNFDTKYKDLTDKQKQVIKHSSGNLLVSASAGSGKTKVLITKLVDLILNKQATLSELLVVTFTNDASTEMKVRLAKELQTSNDDFLRAQLDDLSTSDILTFDKFCIKVVREFGYEIGITNGFGVADDSLAKFLQSKALDNIFNLHNKNADIKYQSLMEQFFGNRSFSALKSGLTKVYNFLRTKSLDDGYYKTLLDKTYSANFDTNIALEFLNNFLLQNVETFKAQINDCKFRAEQFGCDYLTKIADNWLADLSFFGDSFEKNYVLLCSGFSLKQLGNKKLPAEEQQIKQEMSAIKAKFVQALENVVAQKHKSVEQLKTDITSTKRNLGLLYQLVDEFDKEYSRLKQAYQVYDFCDFEIFAGKILQNQHISLAIKNRYKYIFIDEYQDTNEIQDQIIKFVSSGDNLMMVGDVKQSIYRFRQAEPKIFLNKYNLYKDFQNANSVIELNKNFRSETDILNFANFVFDGIMFKQNCGVDYKNTSRLEFGGKQRQDGEQKLKMILINSTADGQDDQAEQDDQTQNSQAEQGEFEYYSVKNSQLTKSEFSTIEKEAQIVASEISKMLGVTYFDAKTKQNKKIDFCDIAILSRKKSGIVLAIADTLKSYGIPTNCTYKCNLYKSFDIQIILNILKLVQNRQNDVALISTLSIASNGLLFDDMAKIRREFADQKFFYECVDLYAENFDDDISKKIEACFQKIAQYDNFAQRHNLCELVLHIVEQEKLETYFAINNNGRQFDSHLQLFLNSLNSIKHYSLTEFVNYVDTFASEISVDVNTKDSDNAVQISTIHSSKGLEYPFVIVIDAGEEFGNQSLQDIVLTENDFGISTKTLDAENRFVYDTPIHMAFKNKIKQEERKEEMRLLYVALTRPKNFLTIIGTANIGNISKINTPNDVLQQNSYLKWILGLFEPHEIKKLLQTGELQKDCCGSQLCVSVVQDECFAAAPQQTEIENESNFFADRFAEIVNKKFDVSNLVKKNSVSRILEEDDHYNIENFEAQQTSRLDDTDFALIGTIYHKIMQNIDFVSQVGASEQIQQMLQKKLLNEQELEFVDIDQIENARKNLAKYIQREDILLKEQQFLCCLPANQLIKSNLKDKILVQGIADLIIVKPAEIILVDYKTSRIKNIQNLKQKYETQLKIYAKAIEEYYKKPVNQKIIYSFYLNKEIFV